MRESARSATNAWEGLGKPSECYEVIKNGLKSWASGGRSSLIGLFSFLHLRHSMFVCRYASRGDKRDWIGMKYVAFVFVILCGTVFSVAQQSPAAPSAAVP